MKNIYSQHRRFSVALFFLGSLAFVATPVAFAVVLYENDFEDDPVGTYTVGNLAADWNSPSWNDGVDEGRVAITDDANAFGSKSLVVTYPEGETTGAKSQWKLDLGAGYEELFLSYRIRFGENFDFVRGGKLPGLIGGAGNTGGDKPDGTDGWSARMMWRTNGSSGSPTNGDSANIVQYVYHPDQPGTFGEDFRWDDTTPTDWQVFESETWYHLQHRIVMNTPGQPDGIVQAWLDGEMVLDVQDIRFRDIASLQIDQMYFSTFFGGSSSIWEASQDERVYFDDFVIATEFISAPADFDGSGTVDDGDLSAWQTGYGSSNAAHTDGDADGDMDVDGNDFLTWQRDFQPVPALNATVQIPEPSAAFLTLVAFAIMLSCRSFRLC